MRIGVLLAVAAPAVSAAILAVLGRRDVALVGMGASVAGAALILARAVSEGGASWRGFEADVWRAGVALAVAAVGLAAVAGARTVDRTDAPPVAARGAATGAILAGHLATASLFLAVTAVGILCAAVLGRIGTRTAAAIALSDVAVIAALWLAASQGALVPPRLSGVAAWLAAAGALMKLTTLGAPRWLTGAGEPAGAAEGLVLGAVRAHGVVIAAWVVSGGGSADVWLAGAAAWIALGASRAAARSRAWRSGLAAAAALVAVGLGTGTPGATAAAGVLAAGVAVTAVLVTAGERAWANPSIGAAPLGATFAGAAWVATEALARAVVDRPFVLVALPAAISFVWLAQASAALHPMPQPPRGSRAVLIGVALGAVAVLAFLPGSLAEAVGPRIGVSITGSAPLGTEAPAVGDVLGIAFAIAALGALGVTARWDLPVARGLPAPARGGGGSRALALACVAVGVGLVLVIPIVLAGIDRGFL